jgi:hypothetical protein
MLSRFDAIPIPGLGRLDFPRFTAACRTFVTNGDFNSVRLAIAEAAFMDGRFDVARRRYARVGRESPLWLRARLMDDWIRFHQGDFSTGWPRYPGADFEAPTVRRQRSDPAGWKVEVADPRQPRELATDLGMRRWSGDSPPDGPLLVWFNFKDSLGGEILASRLVRPLQARHTVPLVLACAGRLVGLVQSWFPECVVVDKKADLVEAARGCGQYVLVRDLLRMLVARDEDFRAVAAGRLREPPEAMGRDRSSGRRPRIALSWKTTNDEQGRYRNVPASLLADVIARHDVDWHVAQHGDIRDDIATFRRRAPHARIHVDTLHPLGCMAAFAAELTDMDMVVTTDNTLLHLAGAMGIPTLAMLSMPAYWAWPDRGQESRWYASVKLLRQHRPGGWADVLASIDAELESLAIRN